MLEPEFIKDFSSWHKIELRIEKRTGFPYFNEREIWFCSIGTNVGREQDGKGAEFWRPVLIVKKYNKEFFTAVPLTTKFKKGNHYFDLTRESNFKGYVILSQIRSFSSKRLANRIDIISEDVFIKMKLAASEYIFGS